MLKIIRKYPFVHLAMFLLLILSSSLRSYSSIVVSKMTNFLTKGSKLDSIIYLIIFLVLDLFAIVLLNLNNYFEEKTKNRVRLDFRNRISMNLVEKKIGEYRKHGTDHFLDLQINTVDLFSEQYLDMFYNAVYNSLVVFSGLYALYILYRPLAYGTMLAIVVSFIMLKVSGNKMEKINNRYIDSNNKYVKKTTDVLSGFLSIRVNLLKKYFSEKTEDYINDYEKQRFLYKMKLIILEDITYLPTLLIYYGLLILIAYQVIKGNINIGVILGFLNIQGLVTSSSEALHNNLLSFFGGKSIIKEDEIKISDNSTYKDKSNKIPTIKSHIKIRNLNFSYGDRILFNNLNVQIEIGKKYILSGESGCGKSSLLKLIMKQIKSPDSDVIYYDNYPANSVDEEWIYQQIAYINQEPYIYSNTVFYNIFFDTTPNEDFIQCVLHEAELDEFVKDLEDGLDTLIIENGVNLSGGQKQRIAIARALAQDKKILFMDEPTRSLNEEMALKIESKLFSKKQITIVMITHSIKEQIVKLCDEIINLDKISG